MKRLRMDTVWQHGSEITGTILRVVLFYALFMIVLVYAFPQGTGLGELYRELVLDRGEGTRLDFGEGALEPLGPVAVISRVTRNVTDRAADEVVWKASSAGKDILDRHAIQTQRRSSAEISFGDADTLSLAESSLVVIRRPESRRARSTRPSLLILGGQVSGRVTTSAGDSEPLRIETGSVSASVRSTSAEPADFSVTNNPDESSTVSVFSGEAEVTAQGRTERVGAMQSVTVEPGQAPGAAVAIPAAPLNLTPPNDTVLTYGTIPPQVRFGWAGGADIDGYRIVIARDAEFEEIVYEETVTAESANYGRLRPGLYYWQVISSRGTVVSRPSVTRRLEIKQDLEAPEFHVELPAGAVETAEFTIRGTSEPGARIIMAEQQIPVDESGRFELTVLLDRGPNLIALTAVDPAGNVSYYSEYVVAEF